MTSLAYAALWLFIFSVPWEGLTASNGITVITRVTGALALGLTLSSVIISARVRRWRMVHVLALLFVLWCGLGIMMFHMPQVPRKFYTFVQLFAVLWMIWELAPSRGRVLGLLLAYVGGAYVSVFGTLLLFRREAGVLRRFSAGGVDPNTLAMMLAMALPMAWYLGMYHQKPWLRWVCRAYVPIGMVAIGLTGSRGGMIASLVALLFVPLSMTNLSPGRLVTAITVLSLSGALAVAYVPDRVVQRLATTGESVEDLSFGGRFRLWRAGANAFARKPLMGHGVSSFKRAVTADLGSNIQVAHNSYLSVLVEEGLIGFLMFSMMLFSVFLAVLRLSRLERRFALVLFFTAAVAMLPLTMEDHKSIWVVLGILIGFSAVHQSAMSRVFQPSGPVHPRPFLRPQPASRLGDAGVARARDNRV